MIKEHRAELGSSSRTMERQDEPSRTCCEAETMLGVVLSLEAQHVP